MISFRRLHPIRLNGCKILLTHDPRRKHSRIEPLVEEPFRRDDRIAVLKMIGSVVGIRHDQHIVVNGRSPHIVVSDNNSPVSAPCAPFHQQRTIRFQPAFYEIRKSFRRFEILPGKNRDSSFFQSGFKCGCGTAVSAVLRIVLRTDIQFLRQCAFRFVRPAPVIKRHPQGSGAAGVFRGLLAGAEPFYQLQSGGYFPVVEIKPGITEMSRTRFSPVARRRRKQDGIPATAADSRGRNTLPS